jgi:hypothetical protein
MAAELLGREPSVCGDRVRRRTRVLRVFAARNRSGAWAYLDQLGWRRVDSATAAGARDLLSALCRARLAGTAITAEVTGTTVVAVCDDAGDAHRALLAEPRFTGIAGRERRRTDRSGHGG